MKRFSSREFALLCLPLLFVAGAGWLSSRREAPDINRVALGLNIAPPTTLESLDGTGAALSVGLQGPQFNRWKLLNVASHLEIETPDGMLDSRSPEASTWSYIWMRGQTATRTCADFSGVPKGKLRYVCEALVSSKDYPSDKPHPLTKSWVLNRAALVPPWTHKPREPMLVLSAFKITHIGTHIYGGKKQPFVRGEAQFDSRSHATTESLDVLPNAHPFTLGWSTPNLVPSPAGASSPGATPQNLPSSAHWILSLEISNSGMPARWFKAPVHVSGRVSAGNRWPLAFQIESFDFAKVKVGQKLKFKSWPLAAPIP